MKHQSSLRLLSRVPLENMEGYSRRCGGSLTMATYHNKGRMYPYASVKRGVNTRTLVQQLREALSITSG